MLRGYWRIVLAAVGWLILCSAQPPAKQAEGGGGTQEAGIATQTIATPAPAPSASPTSAFTAYPGYNPDPCYRAKDKDAADLCAQWRAAIAGEKAAHEARRANLFSMIAASLSFATVIGLIVTIWQTSGALSEARRGNRLNLLFERRSRREARKADAEQARALAIAEENAATASKQFKLASNTARSNLRPWITVEAKLSSDIHVNASGASFTMIVEAKNVGKSAAINVVVHPEAAMIASIPDVGHQFYRERADEAIRRNKDWNVVLNPGENTVSNYAMLLTTKHIAATNMPDCFMLSALVSVTYFYEPSSDVLQTGRCFSISVIGPTGPKVIPSKHGIVPLKTLGIYRSPMGPDCVT